MNRKKKSFFVVNRLASFFEKNSFGLYILNLEVNNKLCKLLLDTGASVSILKPDKCWNIKFSGKIRLKGLTGSCLAEGTTVAEVKIGGSLVSHKFVIFDNLDNNGGIDGIIGNDFLEKVGAKIDYERSKLEIKSIGKNIYNLSTNKVNTIKIPPRCEIVKYFKARNNNEFVIHSAELGHGVFCANTIVKSVDGLIPVRILNVRENEVTICNFEPKVELLENFDILTVKTDSDRVTRTKELFNSIEFGHLNGREKEDIENICAKYSDIFHLSRDRLTYTPIYKQEIFLKEGSKPVYCKPYRLPPSQREQIDTEIQKMLEQDIIEVARCEWSSPLLIVPKKADHDGNKKWRVVVDYRQLNKCIEDDLFPLPCISTILDSLAGAVYFTHLDLSQGYYQIELKEECRKFTSFLTDKNQYQMKRLPMGLKISPRAFSRAMTVAMSGLNYSKCFIYLDDLIVFGKNLVDHNKNLVSVFERLREVNLKLNPSKCEFLKKELLYLGHFISKEGILPDPGKIDVIKKYPLPTNADESKRFTALANYYRRHIPRFAEIAAPLNNLNRKNTEFVWSTDCQRAFETLKNKLITSPVLDFPDYSDNNTFILKTDSSGIALGSILSNSNDRPIAFASRTLNNAERHYSTTEQELLAVVWSVQHFRPYLFGKRFVILTDHRPLIYLFSMIKPSSRLTKFRMKLEEYDYVVRHVPGKENVGPDALSRIQITSDELKTMVDINKEIPVQVVTRAQAKGNRTKNDSKTNNDSNFNMDHPGLVEILKKPKHTVEIVPLPIEEFSLIDKLKMERVNEQGNIVWDCKKKLIYCAYSPKTDLVSSLSAIISFCAKQAIDHVVIFSNRFSRILIDSLKNHFNMQNLKISIIRGAKLIEEDNLKNLILNDYHILPSSGHAGITRMFNNIKRKFYWPGLLNSIKSFVSRCNACQRNKWIQNPKEPMEITTTATTAFQKIFLDLVGPLPKDMEQNTYILTIQCELTKFVEAYSIPNKESETVARAFVQNFVLRYAVPDVIATDLGKEFTSSLFENICKLLNIQKFHSAAYHHQSIGALERSHRSLGEFLRIQAMTDKRYGWSHWIPFWCFSYNNSVQTSTKYSPFELVFGKPGRLPTNINEDVEPLYCFDDYCKELKYRLKIAQEDVRKNIIMSKETNKYYYDKNTRFRQYNIGDRVLLRNNSGKKHEPLFKGPYVVVDVEDPNVMLRIRNKIVKAHKNRIKLYNS